MKSWGALVAVFVIAVLWILYAQQAQMQELMHCSAPGCAWALESLRGSQTELLVFGLSAGSCALILVASAMLRSQQLRPNFLQGAALVVGVLVALSSIPQKFLFDAGVANLELCVAHPNSVGCVESHPVISALSSAVLTQAATMFLLALLFCTIAFAQRARVRKRAHS